MKRLLTVLVLVSASLFAVQALAEGTASAKAAPKVQTWTGEIIDMGCYIGHGAKGEKHKDCATKCIANGMPMGLLTKEGKLVLLTMNHDNPDAYNQCKEWAASMVEVTGTLSERNGIKAIDVTGAKPAAAVSK